MAKKDIKFTLDTIDSNYSPVGTVKQLDSVFFYIKITENGVTKDLTGQTIKLFAIKGDKKLVEQTTKINTTNETEGLVEIELLNSAIQVPGFTYFELEISDNTGIISTSDFILRVDRKVGSDEAIESTNEVATLKEIEIYVAQAKVELQRFKELQTEMLRTNETINLNEEERVLAEEKRVSAENKRALAEEERGTLFTKKEEERGTLFAQKELDRNNTFVQGERERNERFEEAERNRAVAENERVIAEQERKEKFAGFENKINVNTEELEGARTATTGEEFDTLDERIDHEVDRLNKKIEVSMLQQEDKESHVVENTVEGMTADMIVNGRTLINIHPKSIYRFNAPSSEANKYTQDKGENSVITNISEELTSWSYVECGAINRDMFKPNTKYTIIGEFNGIESVSLMDGTAQYSMTNQVAFNNNRAVVQIKSDEEINRIPNDIRIIIYCYNKKTIGTVSAKNVMILEGDWTNKTTPQYFEGIKSFGQQEDKISSLSHGKNFFSEYDTAIFVPKGEYVVSSSVTEGAKRLRIKCEKDDLSNFGGMYYDASGNYQTHQDSTQINNLTFTVTRDCYLTFKYLDGLEKPYNNIQLEKGSASTTYEPYRYSRKDILLQDLGFDEGLRGLEIITDKFNSINLKAIKNIEKTIIDENKTININEQNDTFISFRIAIPNMETDSNYTQPLSPRNSMCNKMAWIRRAWDLNDPLSSSLEGYSVSNLHSDVYIKIKKDKLSTANIEGIKLLLKQWKDSGEPLILYYQLKTPVETPLTESINLKVFNEKTYVRFENAISGTSSFKAPVNTVATISHLNRENRALEEENKNLRQDFESTTLTLTDSDLELVKQNVDMDFRLMEVEFALDIPQAILSSNIKFKNKKGEVKSMARTPYEMMKIVILSGDYDREDYMHKVGKYYERGRMTKEEHDELMSLMTADEVISK